MQLWCAAQGIPWSWTWRPYPGVWLFILLLAGIRWLIVRRAPGAVGPRHRWSFLAGLLVLWASLDWPLATLGAGYLASAHMVQFILMVLVAPPLLLMGLPAEALAVRGEPGLVRRALQRVVHPLFALLFFSFTLAWTHWPPVVDVWMKSQIGSFALDLIWVGAGIGFWWSVVVSSLSRPWFGYPARMAYLVVATVLNTGVFMYLTYAKLPVYSIYELAPPVSWISTRQDQVLAGILMKGGGGIALWTAITVLFALWYLESEREEAPEGASDALPGSSEESLDVSSGSSTVRR